MRSWYKIAGRGELGDTNWEADFNRPQEVVLKGLNNLREHIGEVVLLTGGGSLPGEAWYGVLTRADVVRVGRGDKMAVQVVLENMTPKMGGQSVFTPFIDSWQISVWKDANVEA